MGIKPVNPIVFYSYPISGHAHRVELLLRMLDLPFKKVDIDLRKGEQKIPEFLAMNPFGMVPVIEDSGTVIWDSAAILVYLSHKYDDGRFLPTDPIGAAEVQKWLAIAAGPIASGPALARGLLLFNRPGDLAQAQSIAHGLFGVMNQYLATHSYLAVDRLTIADLAAYTYIAHAPEGGIALSEYPNLRTWLSRIEHASSFVPMPASKAG